jgi:hypothetical protein
MTQVPACPKHRKAITMLLFAVMALLCVPGVGLTAPSAAACWQAYATPAT